MIKGIILDIDGVIVGTKVGYNHPDPHPDIILALKRIQDSGIPISLCTARPIYAIEKLIEIADLDNLHISDAGAVIIDPLSKDTGKCHYIDPAVATEIIDHFAGSDIYFKISTAQNWYISKPYDRQRVEWETTFLRRPPVVAADLRKTGVEKEITHFFMVGETEEQREFMETELAKFAGKVDLHWTTNPGVEDYHMVLVIPKGISKRSGAVEISEYNQIPLENYLAVGDSTGDWSFIEVCGYGAAMGNASDELKRLVKTKPEGQYTIGGHVDQHGIVDILKHFELI